MAYLWDYDEKDLKKTESGRIKILERLINYGPSEKNEKISLKLVKKYWDRLDLYLARRMLLEQLIWGKYLSSPKIREKFSIK